MPTWHDETRNIPAARPLVKYVTDLKIYPRRDERLGRARSIRRPSHDTQEGELHMQNTMEKTHDCIASNRVEGTKVYGADGEKIGTVDYVMIEKRSGQAREAIVDASGFLGLGGKRHSIPWQKLEYDEDSGGYKLDVTEDQLKNAPSYNENEPDRASDSQYKTSVYEYYAVPIYW
jgi:sporulation protein YlmC with PRC-barrel domain